MALLNQLLLLLCVAPLVVSYPFIPQTCYSKVLSMGQEVTQWALHLKRDHETVSLALCTD